MRYVGQTVQGLTARWRGHVKLAGKGVNWELPKAIREHGPESFERRVLCECSSQEELNEAERKWIVDLDVVWPNGYNMRNGAQYTHEATRQLISERTKEAMASMEDQSWKQRQREAMAKSEVKMLISERTKEAMRDPELYERFVEQMSTPERVALISERTKAAMARPEVREKQLAGIRAWAERKKRGAQ